MPKRSLPSMVALSSHSSQALPLINVEQVIQEYLFEGMPNYRTSYLSWSDSYPVGPGFKPCRRLVPCSLSKYISLCFLSPLFTAQLLTGHFYAWYLSCLKCPVTSIQFYSFLKGRLSPTCYMKFSFSSLICTETHSLNFSLSILL